MGRHCYRWKRTAAVGSGTGHPLFTSETCARRVPLTNLLEHDTAGTASRMSRYLCLTDTKPRANPESRRRKRKKVAAQRGKQKSVIVQATTAEQPRRWWVSWAKGWQLSLTIFGSLGSTVSILVEWPRPTVERTNPPEASNPFSGIFKVANGRFYPLHDVQIEAYLWCAKIGRGYTADNVQARDGKLEKRVEWTHYCPR